MKNLHLWTVLISCILVSCTTDSDTPAQSATTAHALAKSDALAEQGPGNADNPYDMAGQANNELLEGYYATSHNATTIEQVRGSVFSLAAANPYLAATNTTPVVSLQKVALIIGTNPQDYPQLISGMNLSGNASLSFSDFITGLSEQQSHDYGTVYNFIANYENDLIGSSTYSSHDKSMLLTATSVARYSIYYRKKRKDRDWDASVANILAAAWGADENVITAVTMAAITDISINGGISN